MRNLKVVVAYDGSNYHGFQIQNNAMTIQEKIQIALKKLLKEEARIVSASRTDAGVHAKGHVFNLKLDSSIPTEKFALALNTRLPDDIVALSAEEVESDFHARYFATGKRYSYRIYNDDSRLPFFRNYTYHIKDKLDLSAMRQAAKDLVGEHDFSSFRAAACNAKTTVREIYQIEIKRQDQIVKIEVEGSGFLHNMVRIISGTLIEIGLAKKKVSEMKSILAARDRLQAGFTAPGKALFLEKVYY